MSGAPSGIEGSELGQQGTGARKATMSAERRGGSAPAHCRRLGSLLAQLAPTGAASFSAFTDANEELHPLFTGRPNLMLVPIATPLLASGDALDIPSLQRYVDHLYAAGCEGLYVGGSSGEGYHIEEALRQELAVACVEASRGSGKIVMVHVGASRESEAFRLAAGAVAAGADAIASIPPYVGSPAPTFSETLAYYTELARIADGVPVICYNIPGLTGVPLSVAQLAEIMAIDGVEGASAVTKMRCAHWSDRPPVDRTPI